MGRTVIDIMSYAARSPDKFHAVVMNAYLTVVSDPLKRKHVGCVVILPLCSGESDAVLT